MRARLATITAALVLPLALAGPAAAAAHGFHDPKAPREAATILNTLPDVDGVTCHWKVVGHTIGCVGMVQGERAQLLLWSGGRRVLYHVCVARTCGGTVTAKHVFGRPY